MSIKMQSFKEQTWRMNSLLHPWLTLISLSLKFPFLSKLPKRGIFFPQLFSLVFIVRKNKDTILVVGGFCAELFFIVVAKKNSAVPLFPTQHFTGGKPKAPKRWFTELAKDRAKCCIDPAVTIQHSS